MKNIINPQTQNWKIICLAYNKLLGLDSLGFLLPYICKSEEDPQKPV